MTEQTVEQEVNVELELQKALLKVQALKEAVTRAGLKRTEEAGQYEDQVADLRVELTLAGNERDSLKAELEQLKAQKEADETPKKSSKPTVVPD